MRYRPPRSTAQLPVTLAIGSPPRLRAATLRSISPTGARITATDPVEPGTKLQLVIQGKRWGAKAVWWDDGEAGLAFIRPLTEGELTAIRNQGGVSTRLGCEAPARNHHGFREMG